MATANNKSRTDWLFIGLIVFTFLFLLGTRGLNEPDEGRFSEIAREMGETGNWLVPHIWYVPHLDKPPLTYWLLGLSIKFLGVNEWAARLPLALAGLSGVLAAYRLAETLGNREIARWTALILSSSLLYFVMARMITTDMFLTQFLVWALYFFWRSWRALDDLGSEDEELRGQAAKRFFGWHLLAWVAISGGFLAKGPIILLVGFAPMVALMIYRRDALRNQLVIMGTLGGLGIFTVCAVPWFVSVFQSIPESFTFMVKGQLVKHAVAAESKGRSQPFYFFIPILIGGFLPWTPLLGWLWRRDHWRSLDAKAKEAWLLLSVWVGVTFVFFSINSAKLPHYILPMFPGLAILVALRWRAWETANLPAWVGRCCAASPLLILCAIPIAYRFAFKISDQPWQWPQVAVGAIGFIAVIILSRKWSLRDCLKWAHRFALANLFVIVAFVPTIETRLKSNLTFKPLGEAIQHEYKPGDVLVVWGRFPQGLPFYTYPVINATNIPYLGGLPTYRLPLEFPGNAERLGKHWLTNDSAFNQLLQGPSRVLVVSFQNTATLASGGNPLRLLTTVGDWQLLCNK